MLVLYYPCIKNLFDLVFFFIGNFIFFLEKTFILYFEYIFHYLLCLNLLCEKKYVFKFFGWKEKEKNKEDKILKN